MSYADAPGEVWRTSDGKVLAELGRSCVERIFDSQAQHLAVRYTDGRAYLVDLDFLREYGGTEMTTIVIEQAEVRLTPQQLVTALRQLSPDELEGVFRQLDLPAWQERFDALLAGVRQRALENPISDEEIAVEVEAARFS